MTEKLPKSDSEKGFAAFSSMVSDVSKDIELATRELSNSLKSQFDASSISSTQHTTAQTEAPRVNKVPESTQLSSGSSVAKWLWGIGIAIVVLIGIGNSGKRDNSTKPPSPAYSPPPPSVPVSRVGGIVTNVPESAYTPSPTYAPAKPTPIIPPVSIYSAVLPSEDKPPIGTNISLSRDQIRYCLSEDIRLGAMKDALNRYVGSEVDLFNSMIHDYNSRCGKFRYRRGSLELVRSEVEANRLSLMAEGSARLVDSRPESAHAKPKKVKQNLPK